MSSDVPTKVSVRLDDEIRALVQKRMENSGMTLSQVTRVALFAGLREIDTSLEAAFVEASFREGVFKGVSVFYSRVQRALKKVLSESSETEA